MEQLPAGEYVTLVVQLSQAGDGSWRLRVDGLDGTEQYALRPMTAVVRLHRSAQGAILRGTIRLEQEALVAPLQTSDAIGTLLRAWLRSPLPPGL